MAAVFAAGGLVPFATWLLLLPVLGAWDFYRGGTMLRPAAVLVLACVTGGVVAGSALGGGVRRRAGLGVAFGATFWIPLFVVASLSALSGTERFVDLLVGFTPVLAASHALLGALGLALGGCGRRRACEAAAVLGGAGGAGGVLLALAVRVSAGSGATASFAVSVLGGGGAACLLPLALAGWWLGRRPRACRGTTAHRVRARVRCAR